MDEQDISTGAPGVRGRKPLYAKPELFTLESHGKLGFRPAQRPFDFVRETIALPITTVEFAQAQRNFPIVFSDMDNPVPLVVMGIPGGSNLFVDSDGRWDRNAYVPGYMRCHPFALAPQEEGRVAVVIDAAAACISDDPVHPFFVDGRPGKQTEELIRFCGQFEAEREKTLEFTKRLKELDLLATQRVARNPGEENETPLADFVGVDARKLEALDDALIVELHRAGYLQLAWMQYYSVDNWRRLAASQRRQEAA